MTSRILLADGSPNRVLVVANPSAGSGARQDQIRNLLLDLNERGLAAQAVGDLAQLDVLAARLHAAGELRAVVAAGGDGTIAEVVNRTAPDVPITVYPMGTANLLAGYFQLTADSESLARTLIDRATVRLDAGRANGRIFTLMAGCGFDADVVARLHRKRHGGNISYWTWAMPLLESIRSYHFPDVHVYCESSIDGQMNKFDYQARWAFAVNLPCYVGGLLVAPEANGMDGRLNVATFGRGSFWHALRYVGLVALGWHQVLSDYRTALVQRVRIESAEVVPYQLDGDPGGLLPLDIEVLPKRMTLIAPRKRLAELVDDDAPLDVGAR